MMKRAPGRSGEGEVGRSKMGWAVLWVCALGLGAWFVVEALYPGWLSPTNRTFLSRYGAAEVIRAAGKGFDVNSTVVRRRTFTVRYLGEGRIESDSLMVPLIPMSTITSLPVEVGDSVKEGALLAELDDSNAKVLLEAAEASVRKAEAELERVKGGTLYTQVMERPELGSVLYEQRQRERELADELLSVYEGLNEKGVVSRIELLGKEIEAARAAQQEREAEISLGASEQGRALAVTIAELAVEESIAVKNQRELHLQEHRVTSPADGVLREVLVRKGEFNRTPGKTGFVLSYGSWFEARLGQAALSGVSLGDQAIVRLEAYPGVEFSGVVELIHPFIDHDLGGPESTRPIRPRGTGTPEWPSTFRVRIRLTEELPVNMATGLTGFASIVVEREGFAIPTSAFEAIGGREGLVLKVSGDASPPPLAVAPDEVSAGSPGRWVDWTPVRVVAGHTQDGWTEVLSGVSVGDEVFSEGHVGLREGDPVRVSRPSEAD